MSRNRRQLFPQIPAAFCCSLITLRHSTTSSTAQPSRKPLWNKGKLIGQKPPLKPKYVWAIRSRLQMAGRLRDLALFDLAIDSKLRGCEVVKLTVADVALSGTMNERATIRQQKTGRPAQFGLTEQTRQVVEAWIKRSGQERSRFPVHGSRFVVAAPDDPAIRSPRGRMVGEHRPRSRPPRHALAAQNQSCPDLPPHRQSESDPAVAQNSDILPTNSRLKPGSPTAIIRASAKWCRSDGGSKAAASSLSSCSSPTARSRACRHG